MKWTYAVQQKLKVASLLMGVMGLIILFNIVERRNIAEMNKSVTSIYNDRLLPATDIFYLTENLYSKRFLMEKFLADGRKDPGLLRSELTRHDHQIASLIKQFEKTYLVDKESAFLNEFKQKVAAYQVLERRVLSHADNRGIEQAKLLYAKEGQLQLMQTVGQLAELTKIQTAVGGEILHESRGLLATSDLLSSLQMVLAIAIGVIILSLVAASRNVSLREKFFHMN